MIDFQCISTDPCIGEIQKEANKKSNIRSLMLCVRRCGRRRRGVRKILSTPIQYHVVPIYQSSYKFISFGTEPQPFHGLEGLPVDVVANERQVEGQREPLASKHEQNVEQKVQKIFWQYLRKTKVIIINYWIQNKSLKNVPKLQTLRIWIILVRIRMVSKQLKLIQIIQLLSAKKTLK